MKLATTIGEVYSFVNRDPAAAVRMYEGTGFRYLDYSFYNVLRGEHPFLGDDWKSQIDAAGNAASSLGMKFVQAHSPDYNPLGRPGDTDYHEAGMKASLRSVEACGMLGIGAIVVHSGITEDYLYPEDKDGYFKANRPFYAALLEEIIRVKPAAAKGRYLKSITFASSMGPGVHIDTTRTRAFMEEDAE